jgi:hypothetical protein
MTTYRWHLLRDPTNSVPHPEDGENSIFTRVFTMGGTLYGTIRKLVLTRQNPLPTRRFAYHCQVVLERTGEELPVFDQEVDYGAQAVNLVKQEIHNYIDEQMIRLF